MYIQSVQTTKGKPASQRDTSMDKTELAVPQGGEWKCVRVSLFVYVRMIDCQLNPINRHSTNKSISQLLDATDSLYLQLLVYNYTSEVLTQSSALNPLAFYMGASFNLFLFCFVLFFRVDAIRSWLHTIHVDSSWPMARSSKGIWRSCVCVRVCAHND